MRRLGGAAAAITWYRVPLAALPLWTVLSTAGVLLAAIDARTTWLPLRLTRIAWLLMIVGAFAAAALGGWPLLVRSGVGAGVAGGLYFVGWVFTAADSASGRPLRAAVGGGGRADSWRLLLWALFRHGRGGVHGLVRLARSRKGPFRIPSMLAGAYLALAASWLYT